MFTISLRKVPKVVTPIPLVIRNRVAIISSLPTYFGDPLRTEVNVVTLHDTVHVSKGSTITVYPSVFRHMKKIQSAVAFSWTVRPWMQWINRRYVGDDFGPPWINDDGSPIDKLPKAECVHSWGNFVEIIGEVGEFYQIRATPTNKNFDEFDETFNWFNYPHLWSKQSARDKSTPPKITNVGSGYDAYFPILQAKAGLWILKTDVELLPPSPDGGYVLQGMSVYTAGMQPLRLARKPGELVYPRGDWKMQTAGVIPPK
jgi:hypothetical protein